LASALLMAVASRGGHIGPQHPHVGCGLGEVKLEDHRLLAPDKGRSPTQALEEDAGQGIEIASAIDPPLRIDLLRTHVGRATHRLRFDIPMDDAELVGVVEFTDDVGGFLCSGWRAPLLLTAIASYRAQRCASSKGPF
jgi:hypothetical protein